MDTAGREGVSRKARLAGNGKPFARDATPRMTPSRPARREPPKCAHAALPSLTREWAIACARRLAWTHLGGSVFINTTWSEYKWRFSMLPGHMHANCSRSRVFGLGFAAEGQLRNYNLIERRLDRTQAGACPSFAEHWLAKLKSWGEPQPASAVPECRVRHPYTP